VWITDVDIPEDLVEAARSGSLVIFVGAGASRDAPAGLPDFRQLTIDITRETEVGFEPVELESPDRLLGRIGDAGVDIHQRVRSHIDVPGSAPNDLHAAIIDLAAAAPAPRIVTTNYDTHLTRVVEARGLHWPEFMAPALPMGDDFEGIVYLHGSLLADPRHLIATDADFGRAYLTDAWAARFLERMFAKFTVLFIGYSHSDVVMHYLGRSLGSRARRYVLTSRPDEGAWRQLNIVPVGYQVEGTSHSALTEAVAQWARLLSMRLLDHRQRIAQLVGAPPSSVPEEQSYLRSVIGDNGLVTLFTDLAGGEAWLTWVVAQAECQPLFGSDVQATGSAFSLARWFARQCLADEALSSVGLRVVSEAGGQMSAALWNAVGQQLHASGSPRAPWLGPWITLLVENAPPEGGPWLEYALIASTLPDDREAALLLLDYLVEPYLTPKPSFGLPGAASFGVEVRGDGHWLHEAWAKVLQPHLATLGHDLLAIADRHIRRARQLLVTAGAGSSAWDPVSFRRSSIAAHHQDRHGDKVGILIDVARDCLELLVATDAPLAEATVGVWLASDAPILRRLAIHGVAVDGRRSGSEKLNWLLEHSLLFEHQLMHEVFELLEAALPSADEAIVDRLVAEAALGPADIDDPRIRAYEAFNALVWIDRYSTSASANEALAHAQGEHPDFGIREHPDFSAWMEGGIRASVAPMPMADFRALLQRARTEALSKLSEFKSVSFSLDGPTWDDAVSFVTEVVKKNPEDGLVLLGTEAELDEDLVSAVIHGWASSELTDEVAQRVIGRVSTLDLDRWSGELARLIGGTGAGQQRTEWHRFVAARELALDLARRLPDEQVPGHVTNWLEKAINSAGGLLAEFWLQVVSYEWNGNNTGWAGLSVESRGAVNELTHRADLHGALAEVIIASQLHFFFAADREWCQANVLPLLAWEDPARARRTWDGFLHWGRWTDELLEAGLLGAYIDTARNIDNFADDMPGRFAEHLAALALYSATDPGTWTAQFTRIAPDRVRVMWLDHVGWVLGQLDAEVVTQQWNRWMRGYWAQRLASIPLTPTFEEASALAGWVIHLEDAVDEAVDLAVAAPAGLEQHGGLLGDLREKLQRAPAAYARLLGHLLSNTAAPFWDCHDLQEIVAGMRDQADEEDIRRIREHGLRLGCLDAVDW